MTSRPGLTPSQRGILIALASAVVLAGLVLAALLVFRSSDDPDVAQPATTTTAPVATTTAPSDPVPTTTAPPDTTTTTVPETTTTTEPAETTTTTDPVREQFELKPEGLDRLFFGEEPDVVIDEITDRLGEPTDDTGWVDQLANFDGLCGGTDVRFVSWDNLRLFFTDRESEWTPGEVRHFEAYIVTEGEDDLVFATAEGVTIGSTRAEIEDAYGDSVSFTDHPVYEEIFEVDPPGAGFLYGTLTGLDDDDRVIEIVGGTVCGE